MYSPGPVVAGVTGLATMERDKHRDVPSGNRVARQEDRRIGGYDSFLK